MELAPGVTISRYRLVEKIGQGGMGVVWKALDEHLRRHVAIEILPADLMADEERRLRFKREAQAAAALSHPNIAVIHEVGEKDGIPFIVMEHLRGRTLRYRLKERGLKPRELAAAYYHLRRALIAQGRIEEAIDAFEYCGEIDRTSDFGRLGMGHAYRARGDFARSVESLDVGKATPINIVYLGAAHAGLGERERALTLLEEAVEGGYRDAPFLEASGYFESLRSDPRFGSLVEAARRSR